MKFFGLIEYPKNNVSVNKMEQEEQGDEYINAFDFLNNLVLTLLRFVIRNGLFCFT